jgi:hypothetical protein
MQKRIFVLLSSLLLAACSQSGLIKQDTASTLYLPPVGTLIELKKPMIVPPGQARIFLQRGESLSKQAINRYYPSCNFEIRTLSEQPQQINPETFLVTAVQRVTEQVVHASPVLLASRGFAGMDRDGGLPMLVRGLHLKFSSDTQPDLMRLTCRGGFDDAWKAELPSIDQMREALGEYADLRLP